MANKDNLVSQILKDKKIELSMILNGVEKDIRELYILPQQMTILYNYTKKIKYKS